MAFCFSSSSLVSSSLQQRSSLKCISERPPAKLLGSHSLKVHSLPPRFYLEKGNGLLAALRRQVRAATSMAEIPSVQKGWKYSEYGPPDVLTFGELPVPQIADDQVLVKVAAAALNPVDFKRRQGYIKDTDSPFPTTPGYDVAGTVVAVGKAVTGFKVGDDVFGDISEAALDHPKQCGSLAQYTAVEHKLLAPKPRNLSFAEAACQCLEKQRGQAEGCANTEGGYAALPLALLTAYEGFERVKFSEGESVIIIGGAGGVGSLAIQLAKVVFKASVVATTASAQKTDFVKSLGADRVIDYRTVDYTELPEKYDFVFDTAGEGEKSIKVLKEGGRMAVITGKVPKPGFRYVLTSDGSKLAKLVPYFESGALKPILDPRSPYAFSQLKEAFEYLETGRAQGKVVVAPIE